MPMRCEIEATASISIDPAFFRAVFGAPAGRRGCPMQQNSYCNGQINKRCMKNTLIALFALLAACQPERHGPEQDPSKFDEFTLAYGQTKKLAFDVQFTKLIQESRCPTGAVCIQKGTAIIALTLAGRDQKTIEIDQAITYVFNADTYKISFLKLDPYPEINKTVDPQQSQAQLRVEKL